MRAVGDRLSVRWYPGYDLHEPLPYHSPLTRIRERCGLAVFRRFFARIVEECIDAGLVWGEELFFDATKGEANASLDSAGSRALLEGRLEGHLEATFPEEACPAPGEAAAPPGRTIDLANCTSVVLELRQPEVRRKSLQRCWVNKLLKCCRAGYRGCILGRDSEPLCSESEAGLPWQPHSTSS
jgi:hypothetical protein